MRQFEQTLYERVQKLSADQRTRLASKIQDALRAPGTHSEPVTQCLVAYVVGENGASPSQEALRGFADEILPDYMVPQTFVVLDDLPRTPGGKIDRQASRQLEWTSSAGDDADYVAPRSETEKILAHIWADVLSLDDVGIHDDFFEVSGDSLLSIRILSRAGQEGIRVRPEEFFSHPTIAEQAAAADDGDEATVQTQPVEKSAPLGLMDKAELDKLSRLMDEADES